MSQYEVIGSRSQVRGLVKCKDIASAEDAAQTFDHCAIYRMYDAKGNRFHSTADEAFLVKHYNDPFWINRGVKSA
jgi:hypothetical protein